MQIISFKECKSRPLRVGLGKTHPCFTKEIFEGMGLVRWGISELCSDQINSMAHLVKSPAVSMPVFGSVLGYPANTKPFAALPGTEFPLSMTALDAEARYSPC